MGPILTFSTLAFSFFFLSGHYIPISKCVEEEDGYHLNRALVVAPERSIQFLVDQLNRIISEFKEYILYIITSVTRYVSMPCT